MDKIADRELSLDDTGGKSNRRTVVLRAFCGVAIAALVLMATILCLYGNNEMSNSTGASAGSGTDSSDENVSGQFDDASNLYTLPASYAKDDDEDAGSEVLPFDSGVEPEDSTSSVPSNEISVDEGDESAQPSMSGGNDAKSTSGFGSLSPDTEINAGD